MITKFDKFNLIKESPDVLKLNDIFNLFYYDDDAIPFFVHVDKNHSKILRLNIGSHGVSHGEITQKFFYRMFYKKQDKAFAGRLWKKSRVISFWVYPNVELFKEIIKKLEKKLNIQIFNNGWRIEVIKKDNQIQRKDFDPNSQEDDYYFGDRDGNRNNPGQELIPIEDYIGSEDFPEELRIQHMLSWQEKDKLKKEKGVKGFGSGKTAWDKPHNIKWRQAIYQENKNNN